MEVTAATVCREGGGVSQLRAYTPVSVPHGGQIRESF